MISAWLVALRATAHAEVTQGSPGKLHQCRSDSDSRAWQYWLMVLGVVAGAAIVVVALLTGHAKRESPDDVDCAQVKCVALTFDDGPGPTPTGCCRS